MKKKIIISLITFCLSILLYSCSNKDENTHTLLNVSYDPTREMYQEFNKAFLEYWKDKTGETVVINQSHGGAGKQARAVIDGLEADVVTLALAYDVDAVSEKTGILPANWQSRLPNNSCPYTSTIVFLVRKGNPKNIQDWDDLVKDGIEVITPNPKTSGGARWNYLAAWAFAMNKFENDESKTKDFMKKLFMNVPVLDSGARGSTNTFVQREIGDVLLAWENEALLAINSMGQGEFEIVVPSLSIIAEPPVTVIDKYAEAHNNKEIAEEYLKYLFTEVGQEIVAKHFYRPQNEKVLEKYKDQYPKLNLFSIDEVFGGWQSAQKIHFNDGGIFDSIFEKE